MLRDPAQNRTFLLTNNYLLTNKFFLQYIYYLHTHKERNHMHINFIPDTG